MKKLIKKSLNRIGYDLVRVPLPGSHGRELMNTLRRHRINCVLDVGARHGEFAGELRALGFDGHIFSFEPVKENFEALSRRMQGDPRWKGFNVALGSEAAELELNVTSGSAMSSFLEPNDYAKAQFVEDSRIARKETVEVRPLGTLLPKITAVQPDPRCYLKLDTQGWDLQVFRGLGPARGLISALQSEVSVKPIYESMPTYTEAVAEYQTGGFELVGLYPVHHDSRGAVIEFDCLMQKGPDALAA